MSWPTRAFCARLIRRLTVVATLVLPIVACTNDASAAYDVHACLDEGSSASWVSHASAPSEHLTTFAACSDVAPDPYASLEAGVGVVDTSDGGVGIPSDGRYAENRFSVPTGTRIIEARIDRDMGNRDVYWQNYAQVDGVDQLGESCTKGPSEPFCRIQGTRVYSNLDAATLAYGIRCQNVWGSCTNGSDLHRVWAIVRSASVTLDDLESPTVGAPSGVLADGEWHRGSGVLAFEASDNTGVRVRRLVEGSVVRATRTAPGAPSGCGDLNVGDAYTYVQPCAGTRGLNGVQAVSVPDVCAWGDGVHAVRAAAVDTGGREAVSSEAATVRVDCTAPAVSVGPVADVGVAVGGLVQPVVSAEDARTPVASVEVQVQVGSLGWQPYTGPVVAQAGSAYRFRARATDSVGNVSAWSAPSAWTATTADAPGGSVAGGAPALGGATSAPTDVAGRVTEPVQGVLGAPLAAPIERLGPASKPPRRSLTIRHVRRHRGVVVVRGSVAGSRATRLAIEVALRGRRRPLRRTVRVRAGAFDARIRLPARTRPARVIAILREAGRPILHARRAIPAR
jgi:hypothetical protein